MLRKLVDSGDVKEGGRDDDGRMKLLALTAAGRNRVARIHAFARAQVGDALARLKPGEDRTVLAGLRLYTEALAAKGEGRSAASPVEIARGYRPSLIARITEMHALYYARTYGFGQAFESVVAGGLSEFCNRLNNSRNAIWAATQGDCIVGSIAIDGEDMGQETGHLRWFITDDATRGNGAGRKLLSAALSFADEQGFTETHLWTFSGLSAARHLYETNGFTLAEECPGTQWGHEVLEQRFVRPARRISQKTRENGISRPTQIS